MNAKFWDRLIRPSSRAFYREARQTPGYTWKNWLHGYVYARWPYLYIGIGTGEHPAARSLGPLVLGLARILGRIRPKHNPPPGETRITFADTYHGKVVPLEAAKQLVLVNEEIRLPNLEKVIPYSLARGLILQNPDHIVALECPCRSARSNPCLPLDVCLIVGEPFASFVREHHPQRSRPVTQAEAVEILQAEDARGHVHHAFFKDAMLGRFYAICNCCTCCCGALQAHRNGTPMLASSGYLAQVDEDRCIGCGSCQEFCQFGALSLQDYHAFVNEAECMGCGVCANHCDQGALALVREASRGEPLEILASMDQVA